MKLFLLTFLVNLFVLQQITTANEDESERQPLSTMRFGKRFWFDGRVLESKPQHEFDKRIGMGDPNWEKKVSQSSEIHPLSTMRFGKRRCSEEEDRSESDELKRISANVNFPLRALIN